MYGLTKTHYYMATQRELNPIVKSYFKDKFGEEARMSFRLQYMQRLNKSFRTIMHNPTIENVETQLSILTARFSDDEKIHTGMMRVTCRYWRNIMTLENLQHLDVFPHIYKKCEDLDAPETKISGLDEVSYTITNDNIEQVIKCLYLRLKQNRCISDDTKFSVFSNAFTGKPLNEITERIKWIRSKKLCVYFICQLLKIDLVGETHKLDQLEHSIETEEYHYWKKLEHLFKDKNGESMLYGDRVKGNMTNLPKDSTIIESILLKPF